MENPVEKKEKLTSPPDPDRLSALPDPIVAFIVGKLSFKEGARTTILGKRYRTIWPCSPSIELDETWFTAEERRNLLKECGRLDLSKRMKRRGQDAFVEMARRFFVRYCEPKIDCFRLCFSDPSRYASEVDDWIKFAVKRDIEELHLDFMDSDINGMHPSQLNRGELPDDVYEMCGFLHTLTLSSCRFQPDRFGGFSALRTLSLEYVDLEAQMLEVLMANCRCLGNLSLAEMTVNGDVKIIDKNKSLTRLNISYCYGMEPGCIIEAPKLNILQYTGSLGTFVLRELGSLDMVEFDFSIDGEFHYDGDHICNDLLPGIRNAKSLTVGSYLVQVIASGDNKFLLPESINKLRHLKLSSLALHQNELPGIAFLLRSYVELETLTIELGEGKDIENYEYPYDTVLDGRAFWESLRSQHFICLDRHLKIVKIEGFEAQENEVELLRFLLERSEVLEEVLINISKDESLRKRQRYTEAAKRLRGFRKASPVVQIVVC